MPNHNNSTERKLLDELIDNIGINSEDLQKSLSAKILETAFNIVMQAERNMHLHLNTLDKGNGFYKRSLGTPIGNLDINVPRDRDGDFRPKILPSSLYQRDSDDRYKLLEALFTSAYSPNNINSIFKALNLHYSPKETEILKKEYLSEINSWLKRELPHDVIAIFIDAYHSSVNIDGSVKKMAAYTVLGVDFNSFKDLFGIYISPGNESKEAWLKVLNDLIDRGLKRPLFIISDDFPGLKDAISVLFPKAYHQLCFIHMQRNVRKNMGKQDAKEFNQSLSQIKLSQSFDSGKQKMSDLLDNYKKQYPTFINYLEKNLDNYLPFLNLKPDIRKHFYTTNCVESFNSILENFRNRMGGFFQSEDALKINIFIRYRQLKKKWGKGIPRVIAELYYLRQLFAKIYAEIPLE
jgi:putative transposase